MFAHHRKDDSNASGEVFHQCLRLAQWSGLADLGMALMILLVLVQEGRLEPALLWWMLLAAAVIGRMVLARLLLGQEPDAMARGARMLVALALAEAMVWAGGLLWAPAQSPWGAALQIVVSVVVFLGGAYVFGFRVQAWLAYALPLAVGQYVFLLRFGALSMPQVLVAWLLMVGLGALLAWAMRSAMTRLSAAGESAQRALAQAHVEMAQLQQSREQMHLALEALGAGVSEIAYEGDKRYYSYSGRYAEILGYVDREAFLKVHRFSAAVHPADRRRVLDARKAHRHAGIPFREEFRMLRADQSTIWVMGRGASVRDEQGRATRFVLAIVDITQRREAELALAESARQYRALLNASPSLIWTCDGRGTISFVSERACRLMYGYAPRDVVGRNVLEFNAPGVSRRDFLRSFRPVLRGQPVFDVGVQHYSAQGEIVSVTVSALPTRDDNGRIESVVGVVTDISAVKAREQELSVALRQQQALFDAAGEGIAFVRGGVIDGANRALAKMLGVSRQWLAQRPVADILAARESWESIVAATVDAGQANEAAIHEVALRAHEGSEGQTMDADGLAADAPPVHTVWCQLTSRLIQEGRGRGAASAASRSMVLVLTDITALKHREELAWYQANHDELTGLANRRALTEHARRLLSVAQRQNRLSAVLVMDLDGFKQVNDALGHAQGDALLRRVAVRLSAVLREYDVVARTGGDEFVALLPEVESEAVAMTVGEKMIAAATETLAHPEGDLHIHASVGLALFPADGEDFDALVQRADEAMYAAKASGKNQLCMASALGAGAGD